MKILSISASNSRKTNEDSVSYKVGKWIESKLTELDSAGEHKPHTLCLKDYDMRVCKLCGDCANSGKCPYDDAFNEVIEQINAADRLFFIVPHYSPLPSKLMILFEKMNEIAYAGWLKNPSFNPPWGGKTVGVIGHGGMTESEKVLTYYHEQIVKPVANTLRSLGCQVGSSGVEGQLGACFGLESDECLEMTAQDLFPNIHMNPDWLGTRLNALIENVISKVE